MKKIQILAIAFIAIIGLAGCEGDPGPQGPPGYDGLDGESFYGTTVDLYNVDLDANNEFIYTFSDDNIEVFEDDAVLVYRSTDFIEDPNGDINIWSLMPQTTYFTGNGEVVHNFDHTFFDVRIFLQSNFSLNELSNQDYNSLTQNQYFRIVIVPSVFANDPNNNLETFDNLVEEANRQGFQIDRKL